MEDSPNSPTPEDDDLSKGERTRLVIMQAAVELFTRQGYHGTSMRQIADRAGIALGGIYNHFDSKEDIFQQVSLEYHPIHTIIPALEGSEGDTVEEFVHRSADQMYTSLSEGEDFLSLMFIEAVEFKGRHFPSIFQQMFPRALAFSERLESVARDRAEMCEYVGALILGDETESLGFVEPFYGAIQCGHGVFLSFSKVKVALSQGVGPKVKQ